MKACHSWLLSGSQSRLLAGTLAVVTGSTLLLPTAALAQSYPQRSYDWQRNSSYSQNRYGGPDYNNSQGSSQGGYQGNYEPRGGYNNEDVYQGGYPAPQQRFDLRLQQNRPIQVVSLESDTLYLNNDRTYNYDVQVRTPMWVRGEYGGMTIPAGSVIRGRYEPAPGGLRYVAREVEINDQVYRLNAVSEVIRDVKDPRQTSAGAIATDAAIGAAGGALLSGIFGGRVRWEPALGGAAAGVIVGNVTAPRVVVIRPNQPMTLFSR